VIWRRCQSCSGLCSGLEGAIHAVQEIFADRCSQEWGLLMLAMLSTLLIQWLLCGMLGYCGLSVLDFCLILIEVNATLLLQGSKDGEYFTWQGRSLPG